MSPEKNNKLEICIKSDPAALGEVRRKIDDFVARVGLGDEEAGEIVLSMDEALTNVIRHAYEGRTDRPIEISLIDDGETICVEIRDYGIQVPVGKIHSRDLGDVRPGGLGVHIMHECMDCVKFLPQKNGGTLLVMKKCVKRHMGNK
ncbi:MAG TPA: ATP-binding protein [Phycisphaerae bacterium]|nr:ATP-binding protein [Phycisphaerae bacterium]HPS52850.1 ATP-binding protein [Phycisphaerae bacterium]